LKEEEVGEKNLVPALLLLHGDCSPLCQTNLHAFFIISCDMRSKGGVRDV
jgi:hypothetical protein